MITEEQREGRGGEGEGGRGSWKGRDRQRGKGGEVVERRVGLVSHLIRILKEILELFILPEYRMLGKSVQVSVPVKNSIITNDPHQINAQHLSSAARLLSKKTVLFSSLLENFTLVIPVIGFE